MKPTLRRFARWSHKWLGLLLGLQMIAWLASGLVMAVIPIEQVRGTAWVRQDETAVAARFAEFRIAPATIATGASTTSVVAALRLDEPVYLLREGTRIARVLHAGNGHELPPLDASAAGTLAQSLHREHPPVVAIDRIDEPQGEARGLHGPVWRVRLGDRWNTHVYIDPQSARLLSARNDLWRFFDFFWMLHILDFEEREDINNGLLRGSAAMALFLGLSGVWLLFYSFGRDSRRSTT